MDWKKYYEDHKMTAEEAVKLIKSGDRVILSHAVNEPFELVDAMVANADAYRNVKIQHMVSLGSNAYGKPEYKDNFRVESWFLSGGTRQAVAEGYGDYVPLFFYQLPEHIREVGCDVLLVSISKPNAEGKVSTGTSGDYTIQAIKTAKTVIAQVNECVPFSKGEVEFDITEFDAFVEINRALPTLGEAKIGDVERAIGKNCASIIKDGDCLQFGIGSIPDAVCEELMTKKHLGIHSEMLNDGAVKLYKAGAVDNSMKQIDKGKFVFNFAMGSQALYDFLEENPDICECRSVEYVNHPMVICQNDNVVSVNAAIGIDFYGQVAADMIGYKQFSAIGGQVDFVRGATMSKGGRSIIAMPSVTAKKNKETGEVKLISKITPLLSEGQAVTTSRYDVDYVCTEYGIVKLRGKGNQERARLLISIAHPDFREELAQAYEKMFKVPYEVK